jgi:heme-degrading monooxygenase HmoA
MRNEALAEYGCAEFVSLQQGDEEITLSYWPDAAYIQAWHSDLDHQTAQALGRQRWYSTYISGNQAASSLSVSSRNTLAWAHSQRPLHKPTKLKKFQN